MEVAGLTIAVFNEVFVIGKSIRQVLIDAGDQDNRFRRLKLDFKYQQTLRLALGKLFLESRFIYDNEGHLALASLRNGDFLGGLGLGGYELQLSEWVESLELGHGYHGYAELAFPGGNSLGSGLATAYRGCVTMGGV